MSTLVKNQHYVWRAYLKPWTEKGKIFCFRKKANRLFGSNVTNVASETFFYRVERLTSEDLRYLYGTIDLSSSAEMRDTHRKTVALFQAPFTMQDQFAALSNGRRPSKQLRKSFDDAEKNIGEQYHTMTEQDGMWVLEQLCQKKCEFFRDNERALGFIHYLMHQFFRTPKMKYLLADMPNPIPNLDLSRIWFCLSHILADNVGAAVYLKRDRYRFHFLENETTIPFITSDQPIINLNEQTNTALRLYYPLTPRLAVIFYESEGDDFVTVSQSSAGEMEIYNQLLFERSYDQLYSNDKVYLMKYRARGETIGES